MKKVLKSFNVVTMITLLLSIILPSPSAFATEINKKSWDELQGNDVKIKAEKVNAEIYRGEVAEREHVFQYTIENTGDTPIQELVMKQNNDNEIMFLPQSMKVNGEKLPENRVADFYIEEKDKGGKLLSSNLKIQDLKSHEKITVLIKASRAQHFNKEYKQKISVQKDQVQIGNMSVDVEGIPSEDKGEANADDEADSNKKEVGASVDNTTKKVDEKLKVSVEDKNKPTSKTELEKAEQPVTEAEKQPEKEAAKQGNAEVQAASENASKVQIQTGDKQGFGDPLYSVIAAGNLVQTGNVTLGLTDNYYTRQSVGGKINKKAVDVDNDDTTFNSSTGAFPNIPAGSKVKKAYLFWTAAMSIPTYANEYKVSDEEVRQPVKMKMGNKEYTEVSADSIRQAKLLPYIANYAGGYSGDGYVAFADVTNVIAKQGISQTVTVANVPQIKYEKGSGYYWGNWNLILVYENYKETVKDMKIWEGLVAQKSTAWADINVNKINTPKEGAFKAKFSYFSSQGDPADHDGYAYDYGEYDFGLGYQKLKNINGKDNDVNDSSMTEVQVDGTNEFVTKKYPGYNPDWTNSFSTDIHTYHLEGPKQVKNDLKEGKMRFRAYGGGGDIYVLNNTTFVTEHNAPNLQVDKKALDSAGKEIKEVKVGEEITYQIEVKNDTKNNQAPVSNVKGFDKLDNRLEYVPGSIQYVTGSNKGQKTDDANDDEAEFVNNQIDFRLGEGADATDGGVLQPGESAVITFKVKVKESIQSDTTVKNVVAVKGKDSAEIKYESEDDANVTVTTPKEVSGEVEATKIASNKTPSLGDEVEYHITFKNIIKDGRLDVLTIEDELPSGLEFVKGSLKAEGAKPEPVELKFENGKVIAKYPEIMDMEERSIVFKTKVKETAKIGEEIVNKAIVSDKINPPKDLEEKITPQHKAGKIAAKKKATNKKPKLGEEVAYQISFKNTVENGKLEAVTIEDEIPANLEFVQGSERAEGAGPNPVELKVENGKVIAKYPEITDTEERSIIFKVKVKEEAKAGETIVNKAIVSDPNGQTEYPEEKITPGYKDGKVDVDKSVTNQTPKLGEEVEYRITFHNTVENGKLAEVKIEDTLPEGLEYVENSVKAEGAEPNPVELKVENGKVLAKYPEITDTEERSITFKVKVKEEVKVGGKIVNKAIIDDTKNKPETPKAEITPQYKDGKLEAKKMVNNQAPKLEEEIEYRISFKNTVEHGKLTEVKIEDDLPNGLEYVKDSLKAEGSNPDPVELKVEKGKVLAKYPEITDTKERSITFKVKVKGKVSDTIVNQAIVSDTKHPPETPKAEIIPQHKDGKVEAKKVVNNPSPKLGEEVEYRISFKNTVEDGKLAEVKIEDTLPEGLEYVENSVKAEGSNPDPVELKVENGKVLAKYLEITDTEERSITFKVKVKEEVKIGEKIVNKAIIDDTKNKPETPKAEITPQHKDGKVEAKKVVNNPSPKLGEEVEYRISFKNTVENGKLTEVKIEDTLPKGLEYVKESVKAEGSKPEPVELQVKDSKVIAKYPEITDTEERSIVFKAKVKEDFKVGEGIVNKVVVDDTKDPTTSEVTITPEYKDGKLKAEKVVNNKKPKLGEEVEYRISFKNTVENGKLAEVKVEDEIPAGLEYVENSVKAEGSKPSPVELKVENGKVLAKYPAIMDTKERSIVFKVKVKEEAEIGKEIVNKAIVVDTTHEPEKPHVAIIPQYKDGKIAAQKVANNHKPKLGEEVEYRISFKNTVENGKLAEVNIKDTLPNGLEYVEGSIKAEGSKPEPVELQVKNNKVMAKYPAITDTEERSIVFNAKVKESVKVGEEIVNEAIVDDTKNLPEEPYVPITPQYKDGKIEARKKVSNHEPKLGEEIEYRIIFNNTVKDGKLAEVKIEDEIPAGLEFVQGSEKAEGEEPTPVELKVENGKVTAKYSEIMDTKERSIVFKVKVKDSAAIGKGITNKAIIHVDDPNHPITEPTAKITPQYKDGKIKADKKVSKKDPKLGEEIEYRISFSNTVKDGKLAEVKIEDEIPSGLEFVKDSLKAEGDKPAPVELKEEAGKIIAKYENITDMKERNIIFKVKVKADVEVDKAIVNKAIVDDSKNPVEQPEVDITPQYKDGKVKADKKVSKKDPKLGEEVEYRIGFKNTVENGKLAEVKIEDQLPTGLEYVKDSLKAEGNEPSPVELKEEAGKITVKYENITDTAERSISFKVKVTEAAKVGKTIVNKAIVDDHNPKNPPQKPEAIITPEYKDGKLKAEKTVNNEAPKLGEEVEYRITFRNVVEHGKVAKVKIKDELPNGLEFVEGSERAEGENPKPLHVKVKNGIVLAEYPEITDTKERSIVFKVKVKEKAKVGDEIVNKAVVEDTINPPEQPNIAIQPQYKDGALQAEKTVSNYEPKLGEEIEYRISFENTVENGKLTEVKVEDEIPAGLEYVQDSIKSDGPEPNPVELHVEHGKVTAKYPEITDTKKRSIIFKVRVQETVQVGKEIVNKAIVDDNNPTTPPVESLIPITPQYKDGKLEARKEVSNHEPKLGEEIEYRITFNGTVDGGKLVDVKIEDEIPAGLEYVKDSLKAVGDKPAPTELTVESGKVIVKYPDIMDTKERSIIFKVKVKETVKVGEEITNKATIHVEDPNHPVIEPTVTIKPEYKDGKLKAMKTVSNHEPKLGDEIEYRISFENTVENGKLAVVKVEDEIPTGLEYVQNSLRFEGAEPNPVELKMEFGKVTATYLDIMDRKDRSIIFKAKVRETVKIGEEIVNKAVVEDTTNKPLEPTVSIKPKKPEVKPEDPKEPEVKPEDPKEPEVKPEDPKEPEVKPEDPKEPEV
ncbi:isopeptide-forming domain-containing fimbrial protein, partial [Bacillus mobilis]